MPFGAVGLALEVRGTHGGGSGVEVDVLAEGQGELRAGKQVAAGCRLAGGGTVSPL